MIGINKKIEYEIKTNDIKLKLYEDSKNNKSSLLISINREKAATFSYLSAVLSHPYDTCWCLFGKK